MERPLLIARPNWDVQNNSYAIRSDGVEASFVFGSSKNSFAVKRDHGKKFEWLSSTAYKRKVRTFGTLETAMKAADKDWPLKQKAKK